MITYFNAVASSNPYPPHTGTLVLDDPLSDNAKSLGWNENLPYKGYVCKFTGGSYVASSPVNSTINPCVAENIDFTDFTYEVQMQITQGDCGGIVFRADTDSGGSVLKSYLFIVCQNGHYEFDKCINNSIVDQLRSDSNFSVIKLGANEINTVAVVAKGNDFDLYVNHTLIAKEMDVDYHHGQIGILSTSYPSGGHPTQVIYKAAKVWKQ